MEYGMYGGCLLCPLYPLLLFKCSKFGCLINFHFNIVLISFAGSDSSSASSSKFTAMGIDSGLLLVVGGGRLFEGGD